MGQLIVLLEVTKQITAAKVPLQKLTVA